MKIKHLRLSLTWVFIISMLFHFSCQEYEKEKSDIQSTFDRYKFALLSANGKRAADEVCSQTIQWYDKTRNDALSMNRAQLNRVDLLRKFSILRLRHEFSKKALENMDGRLLFMIAVQRGWISPDTVRTVRLHRIKVSGDRAKAYIKESPLTPAFHFIKENKKWKLALVKSFPLVIKTLQAMKSPGVNEDEWIISLLETISKRKVDKKIFDGYTSLTIDKKYSIGSKVNLHKIGIEDQVIYTLAITGVKNAQTPALQDLKDF